MIVIVETCTGGAVDGVQVEELAFGGPDLGSFGGARLSGAPACASTRCCCDTSPMAERARPNSWPAPTSRSAGTTPSRRIRWYRLLAWGRGRGDPGRRGDERRDATPVPGRRRVGRVDPSGSPQSVGAHPTERRGRRRRHRPPAHLRAAVSGCDVARARGCKVRGGVAAGDVVSVQLREPLRSGQSRPRPSPRSGR